MKHTLAMRRSEMLHVRSISYVWLFGDESACLYHRPSGI